MGNCIIKKKLKTTPMSPDDNIDIKLSKKIKIKKQYVNKHKHTQSNNTPLQMNIISIMLKNPLSYECIKSSIKPNIKLTINPNTNINKNINVNPNTNTNINKNININPNTNINANTNINKNLNTNTNTNTNAKINKSFHNISPKTNKLMYNDSPKMNIDININMLFEYENMTGTDILDNIWSINDDIDSIDDYIYHNIDDEVYEFCENNV